MVTGSYAACVAQGRMERLFIRMLGCPDYHTHIRLKPIIRYMKKAGKGSFMELGCGEGCIGFELGRRGFVKEYVGIDLNEKSIKKANEIKSCLRLDYLTFIAEDVFDYLAKAKGVFDWLILYDFIEHIPEPEDFLRKLLSSVEIKKGIIVSVPTPKYPKVFGEIFSKKIGHLVDGYTREELDGMFTKLSYKSTCFAYNTGRVSRVGAAIYYHFMNRYGENKIWRAMVFLLVMPFRLIDIPTEKSSCSLFFVYVKE